MSNGFSGRGSSKIPRAIAKRSNASLLVWLFATLAVMLPFQNCAPISYVPPSRGLENASELPEPPSLTPVPDSGSTPTPSPSPALPTPPPNLVANPGFEDDLESWEHEGSAMVTGAAAFEGNFSLKLGPAEGSIGQFPSLEKDATYQLSAVAKVSNQETCEVFIYFYDETWEQLASSAVIFAGTSFNEKVLEIRAPTEFAHAKIGAWKRTGTGTCYIDALSLRKKAAN